MAPICKNNIMRKSEITFDITLDNQNIPEKIIWNATDNPSGKPEETKAISLSLWDGSVRNTMKIDLWVKDMPVEEMKLFYVEAIGGMAESLRMSTGDEVMFEKLHKLCEELMEHIQKQYNNTI
jgi:gliding motility-associated protein GldC